MQKYKLIRIIEEAIEKMEEWNHTEQWEKNSVEYREPTVVYKIDPDTNKMSFKLTVREED